MSEQKMTEPEHLKLGAIVTVGVAAIILFILASYWAKWILDTQTAELQPNGPPSTPSIHRAEVGIVNQHLFELDDRAVVTKHTQERRLNSYGWVDRDAGVVHIPMEQAMEAMVKEATP